MAFVETANITRSRSFALQGFLFVCVLILFALIDIRAASFSISGLWIPLIGVYIWPKSAETSSSTVLVFLAGLILDVVSDSPTGLWALVFVLSFLILRPNKRAHTVSRQALWLGFVIWTVIVSLWFVGIGAIFDGYVLHWQSMVMQIVIAGLAFPFVRGIARYARRIASDPADRVDP